MEAYRADLGGLLADDQVAAVPALPHGLASLLKDGFHLHIVEQLAIALLMGLFNGGNRTEPGGQLHKALFLRFLGEGSIHIRPLVVFTLRRMKQVGGGIAQLAQGFEPKFSVFFFVVGGLFKDLRDLLIALLAGYAGKVGVLVARLGFTRKRGL